MAKSILKLKARGMRKQGESIIVIARKLNLPKSTISIWCRDIELTKAQLKKLFSRKEDGLKRAQILGALWNKNKKAAEISRAKQLGLKEIGALSQREFLVAGLAFYLSEGSKKNGWVEFINSDPSIIAFMNKWVQTFFSVKEKELGISVFINQVHRSRENEIKKFWINYLQIAPRTFKGFVWLKTPQKKRYENHDQYFGTARLKVLKSRYLYYKIAGLMEAMMIAKIKPA